jgi:phospholipid-binding lipoprotein MlaA
MRPSPLLAALVIGCGRLLTAGLAGAETAPDAPGAASAAIEPAVVHDPLAFDDAAGEAGEDYDPWEPFNEPVFSFNHGVVDRFVVKPAATGWDKVLPNAAQRSLARAFDNLGMPRRLVNNLLQLRPLAAGGELARFVVNTTAGVVGLFDVAHAVLHLEKNDADMGQTLGVYGAGPGPYLVLPFLPPLTVRDGIGRGFDGLLDPVGYFLPVPFVAAAAAGVVNTVNERSLNLELFADVEESVLDLYSAVRNGYLQRRQGAIEARLAERRRRDAAVTRAGDGERTAGGES